MALTPQPAAGAVAGRRLEPDQRRRQILEVAIGLFGERPYPAVSTAEIARAAGVARGLLNHYFGTKRDLYLEVVRGLVTLPHEPAAPPRSGSSQERVGACVDWFLDTVAVHGPAFVAVTGAEGVGDDPEIEQILAAADDAAARAVLQMLGLPADNEAQVAAIRAYGGLAKAGVREWIRTGALTRDQLRALLASALLAAVRDVLPVLDTTTCTSTPEGAR